MCFGSKWMLMCRSGPCCSSAMVGPSIAAVRITVVAVGKLRPPFVDDVAHYTKMLAGHARMELIEVREDERAERRVPDDAYVSLLAPAGRHQGSARRAAAP